MEYKNKNILFHKDQNTKTEESPYEYYKKVPFWEKYICVALLNYINPMFINKDTVNIRVSHSL